MGMTDSPADKWFSKCIRDRDPLCLYCGAEATDCAHILGRAKHSIRWDMDNAIGLCRRCHQWHHANPREFEEWVESEFPGRLNILRQREQSLLKSTRESEMQAARHYRYQYYMRQGEEAENFVG